MEEERSVSHEQGKKLGDQLGFPFFESSAKDNINVKSAFDKLVDIVCDKMAESLETDPTMVGGAKPRLTDLKDKPSPSKSDGNCSC